MSDVSEQVAIHGSKLSDMEKLNDKILLKLDSIRLAQSDSKSELLACRSELEREIMAFMKVNYMSIPAADKLETNMNNRIDKLKTSITNRFNLQVVWMGGFTTAGIFSAWAINFFELV